MRRPLISWSGEPRPVTYKEKKWSPLQPAKFALKKANVLTQLNSAAAFS